jgi:hypothetical protein
MQQTSGGYMWLQWKNTDFHGPTLMKNYLSVGMNMKGVTLFKKHLEWIVEETVR